MRWLTLLTMLAACDGSILRREPEAQRPGTPPVVQPDPREARCKGELAAGWGPLRRVTHEEYDNSVAALVATALRPSSSFPSQAKSNGYTTGSAQQTVGELQAEAYFDAAERLAEDAVKDLPALLQCQVASTGEAECGRRFVVRFVTRAFRRPLTAAETADYQALLTTATAQLGFTGALETVVFAVLQFG
jgi:Protein of unknown function (DUF1587)/Protein of unknown function (DUF1595)